MFDHVTIRVSDRAAAERFYDTVLPVLGIDRTSDDELFLEWGDFGIAQAEGDEPVTSRLHVGFVAQSRGHVDEFWRVGTAAGYRSDGEPGPRPQYRDDYYGSFLLDPEGNSIEAVHHDATRGGGIDHLWIRVADVDAARRFYEHVAPYGGFRRKERSHFVGVEASFTLLEDVERTRPFHLAFAASEDATVDAFHRDLTAAGYRDNGEPGERAVYHPGYYGAFVLDPDGHNVEIVNHNR